MLFCITYFGDEADTVVVVFFSFFLLKFCPVNDFVDHCYRHIHELL